MGKKNHTAEKTHRISKSGPDAGKKERAVKTPLFTAVTAPPISLVVHSASLRVPGENLRRDRVTGKRFGQPAEQTVRLG
ncbi:unnamed protein product [Calypogeia fissa]